MIVHKVDRLARDRADDIAIGLPSTRREQPWCRPRKLSMTHLPGALLHGIMASIAEFYSKNLAAEVKKGQRAKALRIEASELAS